MKNFLLTAFGISLMCIEDAESQTLQEAFKAVYKNNPSFAKMKSEKKTADEALTQAKIMFLPNIQGQVGVTRSGHYKNYESYFNRSFNFNEYSKETNTSKSFGITVTQNLFNGLASVNRLESASNSQKSAYHRLKANENQLLIKTAESYLNVWAGRQKVDAYIKKEKNLKQTLSAKKSSLTAGMGTEAEVAQAESNYQKAIYERIAAETELSNHIAAFEKLTGKKADGKIELPALKLKLPDSLGALINKINTLNHTILYYKFAALAAKDALNVTKGGLAPRCDLSLQAKRDVTRKNSTPPSNADEHFVASLEITVPIFQNSPTSGNTYSQINIDNEKLQQAECDLKDVVNEVKKACVENWTTYKAMAAMIKSSEAAVKSAELASASDNEESQLGLKSNTDVLVKENQLLDSKIDLVNACQKRFLAMVQLYALINDLNADKMFES